MTTLTTNEIPPLQLQDITMTSRLVVGTGKYPDYETMKTALEASGCSAVTVAVWVLYQPEHGRRPSRNQSSFCPRGIAPVRIRGSR